MPFIEPREAEYRAARNGALVIIGVCAIGSAVLGYCMSDKCPRELTLNAQQQVPVRMTPAELELQGYSWAKNHEALCDTDTDCMEKFPELGDGGPYPLEGAQLSDEWFSETNTPTAWDEAPKRPQ